MTVKVMVYFWTNVDVKVHFNNESYDTGYKASHTIRKELNWIGFTIGNIFRMIMLERQQSLANLFSSFVTKLKSLKNSKLWTRELPINFTKSQTKIEYKFVKLCILYPNYDYPIVDFHDFEQTLRGSTFLIYLFFVHINVSP